MSKKIEKSRGAKAIYSRKEHLKQAKKDKHRPLSLSAFAYVIYVAFVVISDYLSIQPFQDIILRINKTMVEIIVAALIFSTDVIVPITIPNLLQTHFNQKKLRLITLVSLLSSVGLLMFLNIVQKIVGVDAMIPKAGDEITIGNALKLVTLLLYAMVPITSTIALTAISLQRNNYKIYQNMRYCILSETDVQAQLEEITDRIKRDEKKLKLEDNIRFVSAVEHLKCKAKILFTVARMILAEDKSPEEAERILSSEPFDYTTAYDDAIKANPNKKISFEEENTDDTKED